jgi:excisionase family DNA binding protein
MKPVYYTSHEIADLTGVSASAVLSWIDRGWLVAHRTPGGHRRVEQSVLLEFLRQRQMPIPSELQGVKRLLVIDDDPQIIRVVERILHRHAPEVVVVGAEGPIDGLLKIGTFAPDVVLLDAYMPGMNGLEVCQRIRGNPETAHILVIAITGDPSAGLSSAFREAGAAAFLSKPIELEEFLGALGLNRNRASAATK